MSGIRTASRREALDRLRRRTVHEIAQARIRGIPAELAKLYTLQTRLVIEIALEDARAAALAPRPAPTSVAPGSRRSSPPDRVGDHLARLGVTAHQVKEWAVTQGLVDKVRRGRIRGELVDAYDEAMNGQAFARRAALAEAGTGWECRECTAPTIKSPVWIANPGKRAEWKALGLARMGGRGLCSACYMRMKQHGTLDNHPVRTATGKHLCSRCGIPDVATGLCVDCSDFVGDEDDSRKASA